MLKIPEMTGADVAFGNTKHMPKMADIPEEFRKERSRYCDVAQIWFFKGAQSTDKGIKAGSFILTAKPDVDAHKALAAVKAVLGSFEPPHEHKIAACGYMLSEWFNLAETN